MTTILMASPEFDTARDKLSLDGTWEFSYDPQGIGEKNRWHEAGTRLAERITVPGCSQVRHYRSSQGNVRVTDVAIPEQSNTIMLRHGCLHPSWYKRKFTIPADWNGSGVHLHVGGVKPAGEFWINGHKLGSTTTSRSPVRCDLTRWIRFGGTNTVVVRIVWPRMRLDGVLDIWHAWSGLYRSVWVERVPVLSLSDVYVRTSIQPMTATVEVSLRAPRGFHGRAEARCTVTAVKGKGRWVRAFPVAIDRGEGRATLRISMPGASLWGPRTPTLYRASVSLFSGKRRLDTATVRFGFRELSVRGLQVLLNGKPIFLRAGCDDRIYPHTVCPPANKAFYRSQIRKAQAYGFNYVKSAVDVFTREFLDAADEMGYLVCQEMPFGAVGELRALRDHPTPELVALWRRELTNIIKSDRRHPSVAAYSFTSEQPVDTENPVPFRYFSREFPATARKLNPGALIIDVTAAFCATTRTRHGRRDTDLLEDWLYYSGAVSPLHGPLEIPDTIDRPFLLHEWNWVTALPCLETIRRFKNCPLLPIQIPEMIEKARRNGFGQELPAMVKASRKLKNVLRKDVLEVAFEHPRVAGYHHWLIHDIPYCPEGVFNEFWESPRDVSAEEFRTYNDDTVLVLDDHDRRCFEWGGEIPLGVTVAHFGDRLLTRPVVKWRLLSGRRLLAHGVQRSDRIPCGKRVLIPSLGIPAVVGRGPAKLELRCELWEGPKRISWNHWPLWFFPIAAPSKIPSGIVTSLPFLGIPGGGRRPHDPLAPPHHTRVFVTHRLTDGSGRLIDGLFGFMERGGRLLLCSSGSIPEMESNLYRTVMYNTGTQGNMGTLIHPHPALGDFPHEGFCDLPFVPLIEGAYPMNLAAFKPARIRPIIRSNGHHVTMANKAYLFEVGVGKGVLLACSMNLQVLYHVHPAARYLLDGMLKYLAEGTCQPATVLSVDQIKRAISEGVGGAVRKIQSERQR